MRAMRLLLVLLVASIVTPALAQQSQTYYDSVGRIVGSSTNYGQATTYYDAVGRPVGSQSNTSTGSTYYDDVGRVTGSSTRYPVDNSGSYLTPPPSVPSVPTFPR